MSGITVKEIDSEAYRYLLARVEDQLTDSVSFLQSPAYANLQKKDGKEVVYIAIEKNGASIGCGLGIRFQAPGNLAYLYFPYGPIVTDYTYEVFTAVKSHVRAIARRLGCMFVRLDNSRLTTSALLRTAPNSIARMSSLQPRAEWVLPLEEPLDDIWMGMHKHARYNVRLAERAEARYTTYAPQDAPLDTFYELMQTTANRDKFSIFDKEYYRAAFASLKPEEGFVAICEIEGKPAAAALFITHDKQAHYVFAGSSDEFRKIAPAYYLLWRTISHCKTTLDCQLFNFGGVQDPVKKLHLDGVTSFKKRFGGYEVLHANPVDIVYNPLKYLALSTYKRLRMLL